MEGPSINTNYGVGEGGEDREYLLQREHHSVLLEGTKGDGTLSTFQGVFVSCILAIFGVILFLRVSWCLGQVGLYLMLVLIAVGYFVVTLTVLSISAIATNGAMKGGGAYFMISRALGPEFGGSIGLIFYCANVVGSALYLVGFTDALVTAFADEIPTTGWYRIIYGSAILLVLTLVCLVGAKAYAKTSLLIFVVLGISLMCALGSLMFTPAGKTEGYTAFSMDTFKNNLYPAYTNEPDDAGEVGLHVVFGVFFPAVTGIMAGANMSGDLKDPGQAIPKGTLMAVGLTYVFYSLISVLCAATLTREVMRQDYFIIQNVCFSKYVVVVGIFASTLSSALGNQIGASRVICAVAQDGIIPALKPLAKTTGGEPRRAVFLSWFIIQCLLFVGNLNIIAKVTAMFFLLSYAIVNFACFALRISGTPNFRPTFRFSNMWTSILGFVLCIATMLFLDPVYAGISYACLIIMFTYIHYRGSGSNWGHLSQAIMYHQVRKYLLRLDARKDHVKYWRPQLLYFVHDACSSLNVIDFCNNAKKGGLYVLGNVVVGQPDPHLHASNKAALSEFIADTSIKAFADVVCAPTVREGMRILMETSGLGALTPNTVVLGFFKGSSNHGIGDEDELRRVTTSVRISGSLANVDANHKFFESAKKTLAPYTIQRGDSFTGSDFVGVIDDAISLGKNVIVCRNFHRLDKELIKSSVKSTGRFNREKMTLDLWPLNISGSGSFDNSFTMQLLLGHIVHRTDVWAKYTRIRVLTYVFDEGDREDEHERLLTMLDAARIDAEVIVVVLSTDEVEAWQGEAGNDVELTMERYSMLNGLMRQYSGAAGVVFTTFECPPGDPALYQTYLAGLEQLSRDLPPLVMIHGVATLITTQL